MVGGGENDILQRLGERVEILFDITRTTCEWVMHNEQLIGKGAAVGRAREITRVPAKKVVKQMFCKGKMKSY